MAAAKKDTGKVLVRVTSVGASYMDPVEGLDAQGEPTTLQVYRVGRFGEEIEVTEAQAARLIELGTAVPATDPLSYKEQPVKDLEALAAERGLTVNGSGANGGVLKDDLVAALEAYDHAKAA